MTGVLGQDWRADVTAHGSIEPWDGSAPLDWHVAADDRWHSPAAEVAVRQRRVDGAPVFETRAADPRRRRGATGVVGPRRRRADLRGGDQRVAAADRLRLHPGRPAHGRPPTSVPIHGIDLPAATTTVLPIGHRASVTVGLAHARHGRPPPAGPSARRGGRRPRVGRPRRSGPAGWTSPTRRRSTPSWRRGATSSSVGSADPGDDDVGFLVGVGELVRMGELADDALGRGGAGRGGGRRTSRPAARVGGRRRARRGGGGSRRRR